MYEIYDIRELDEVTRKEERAYRIGRKVTSYLPLEKGYPLILCYPDTDKYFQATNIQDVQYEACYVKVKTKNTLYIFKEISI